MIPGSDTSSTNSGDAAIELSKKSMDAQKSDLFIVPTTFGSSNDLSDEDLQIIKELERKRAQLDTQITLYIKEKQKEYDAYAKEFFSGEYDGAEKTSNGASHRPTQDISSSENLESLRNERYPHGNPTESNVERIDFGSSGGNSPRQNTDEFKERSSIREREMELAGLFTPNFLPLIESSYGQRNNSAPELSGDEGEQPNTEVPKKILKRTVSDPSERLACARKSSIRDSKSPSRKKRVSLVIDDQVVRPSETPSADDIQSPIDSVVNSVKIDLETSDGSLIEAWIPEKARDKYDSEDAMDYLDRVGGTIRAVSGVKSPPAVEAEEEEEAHLPVGAMDEDQNYFEWPSRKPASPVDSPSHSPTANRTSQSTTPTSSPPVPIQTMSPIKSSSPIVPASNSVLDHRKQVDSMTPTSPGVKEQPPFPLNNHNGPSSSYVGGIGGSGIDDVDNASVGYPSSLGISYMEQFAALRAARGQTDSISGEEAGDERETVPKDRKKTKEKQKEERTKEEKRFDDDQFLGDMEGI